jgi:undecaprenyl-diphosphatase
MTPEFLIRFIADFAIIPVVLLGTWALIFKIPKGKRWESYCRILMAGLTAYLLAKFIGTIYQPSDLRPFEQLGVEPGALFLNNPGFPSDHTLFATALAAAVWFETRMKKLSIFLMSLIFVMSIGRVLALVHTPLDVVGGIVIALIGAVWYLYKPGGQKVKVNHGQSTHG